MKIKNFLNAKMQDKFAKYAPVQWKKKDRDMT